MKYDWRFCTMKSVTKKITKIKLDFLYNIGGNDSFLLMSKQTRTITQIRAIMKIQLETMLLYDKQ